MTMEQCLKDLERGKNRSQFGRDVDAFLQENLDPEVIKMATGQDYQLQKRQEFEELKLAYQTPPKKPKAAMKFRKGRKGVKAP